MKNYITKSDIKKKFKKFKEAGMLNGFTDQQIEDIQKLYLAQQDYINQNHFNSDEKFLFDVNKMKKFKINLE